MSNTRALVSCTILSLQDSCFIYPCCKGCLSRVIQESKRATCGRCGFTCDLQNVDYRYRLSFKVSRNQDIFGVTVFGGCLNPYFGITAGGLQRFVDLEKTDGTHTVQQLLVKAVEDCFIGRCVIFGLKVPHNNAKTLSGQLVACQIISPCESLMGCTVIAYFKNLLQANSHLCSSESANDICPSQQKDSQSSQRDELNRFDYTPPSCARLDSQPSSEGFTLSRAWQSPGLCFPPEAIINQLSIFSPNKEETRTCKCTCQSNTSQLKHDNCRQDELKNETQNTHRKSFSSSCDMFESSAHFNSSTACDTINPLSTFSCENNSERTTSGHCLVRAKSTDDCDSPFHEKSLYSHSGQNICIDLEDAPLSESLEDFVKVEPQISEVNDTEERGSCKRDQMIQEHSLKKHLVVTSCISNTTQIPLCGDKLSSPMRNVNISWKENDENDCRENLEIKMNNAETPTVLCTTNSSGLKKMPFSPCNRSTNNRLSFSSKKRTLKRKKLTKSRPSVTFCSVNHEKSKYFGHCAQSEVHSVNCKVKQELIVFDDHGEKYNCSVDLFASGQSSMDMNLSDVTEISKVNEPGNVNTSEPGLSGSLLFSPCLQSTPVSNYQHSCGQKTGRTRRRVSSQCSRAIKCAFKSKTTDLGLSDKRLKLDQLPTVGSESFSGETDKQDASCNLSVNVNEWSRDLFESSF
ncbi:DNA damage-induced apoptosis suppressor protein [Anabarilius grahami]|uniref:DNA damage-induced apoptosis suppressor protein n=1 Tax=Anabarilius grahami TaxID=495550 RepID=A0A3N0YN27_ANAGA|nr:DNA damage-induced apoptosis suppressor protein [Anabarilius grahami]